LVKLRAVESRSEALERYNQAMVDTAQVALTISVPTLAVLIGILVNNSRLSDVNRRIDDLRSHVDARFSAMENLFTEKLLRVEQVVDARLKHL
jgi:cell division protein FtsL